MLELHSTSRSTPVKERRFNNIIVILGEVILCRRRLTLGIWEAGANKPANRKESEIDKPPCNEYDYGNNIAYS